MRANQMAPYERDTIQALNALQIYVAEQGGAISPSTGVPGLETFYVHASIDGPRFKAAIKSAGVKRLLDQQPDGPLRYDVSGANPGQHRIRSVIAQLAAPSAGSVSVSSSRDSRSSSSADSGGGTLSSRPSTTAEDLEAAAAEGKLVARTVRQQEAEKSIRHREAAEREQAMRAQMKADLRQAPQPILAGQQHATVPKVEERQRRFFDKAVKTENFTFRGEPDAERFAEALEGYSENDLPWRLTRRDEYGLKRMVEAAQTAGVNASMTIVRSLMRPVWKDQKFSFALNECVRELFAAHALLERITHAVHTEHIRSASDIKALADFGVVISFALGLTALRKQEERGGGTLGKLAEVLIAACRRGRSNEELAALRGAERLQALLIRELATADQMQHVETQVAACVNERLRTENLNKLPGGRHSNDHVDFRRISIVPSIEELLVDQHPFLPRAGGVEEFLANDPQTQLLDRQFRLLREDMIATVRDGLAKNSNFSSELPVMLNTLEDHAFYRLDRETGEPATAHGRGPVGLRFTIENGKMGKRMGPRGVELIETLKRRHHLQTGSLALLRDGDEALAIGRVVRPLRESTKDNPNSDQQIGIAFEDQSFLRLIKSIGGRVLQLAAVPGSFFAYEPVLTCLQTIQELPFREELLLENVDRPRPPMYPGADAVMGQLGENSIWTADKQQFYQF
jgi:hypothetical protein